MPERLLALRDDRRRGLRRGITAVCSAHPMVLRAAMDQARADQAPLLVEASSDQVNHLGGCTGMTPVAYRNYLHALAAEAGLSASRLILGGDQLGPGLWRHEEADLAMEKAGDLVEAYVAAGFRKLNVDAGMPCLGDPSPGSSAVLARRTALLCLRAERAFAKAGGGHPPVYVLGTIAHAPGPRQKVTAAEDVELSLDLLQDAFHREGAGEAWNRVVAVAVQSGAEFGDSAVYPYDRKRALPLTKVIADRQPWLFEAQATDYQHPQALREMVEDGFGILKVGPWLTFACREALFALENLAREMNGPDPEWAPIELRVVLDQAMRRHPVRWKDHHQGASREQTYARLFSYRDRSRYYWTDGEVEAEVARLLADTAGPLPSQLLSLHAPLALDAVLDGGLEPNGRAIVLHAVRRVLRHYSEACAPE